MRTIIPLSENEFIEIRTDNKGVDTIENKYTLEELVNIV
jgi:hypothetical protein